MKSFIKIALGVAALAFVQPASASSTFTITGANAFRVALFDTIVSLMGGNPGSNVATCKISTTSSGTNTTAAAGRKTVNAANVVTFQGSVTGVNGGNPITIYVALNGSATGLIAISNSATLTYASAAATTAGYDNVAYSAATTTSPGAALFAVSDVSQAAVTSTHITGLSETTIAVQPYIYMANKGSTLTNITAQNARLLLQSGVVQQVNLTGNSSDTNNVYNIGRDGGSGTRISVLAETKFGIANLVQNYYAVTSGATGSGTITSLQIWPTSGIANFDPANAGNGGYGSGGSISSLLGYTGGSVDILDATGSVTTAGDTNVAIVSAIGASDAINAANNGAVRLKYSGVQYTGTSDNALIQNGAYTLWSYQRISYKGTPIGDDAALINKIKLNVDANLGSAGISVASMNVSRAGDGGLVGP